MTHNPTEKRFHRELKPPPPWPCDAVFNGDIEIVPDAEVAEQLAESLIQWTNWIVHVLGINKGHLLFGLHDSHLTGVEYGVFESFESTKKDEFDGAQTRRDFEWAVRTLMESEGCLPLPVVSRCLHAFYAALLRLDGQQYGKLGVTVAKSTAHEVHHSPVYRVATHEAGGPVLKSMYTCRQSIRRAEGESGPLGQW